MTSVSELQGALTDPWPKEPKQAPPISSAQFQGFHGTNRDLTEVLPAVRHRRGSHWDTTGMIGQRSRDHAFASKDEDVAWRFARHAAQRDPGAGRARVYEVAGDPEHEIRPGVFNREHPSADEWTDDLKEYVSQKFRVTGRQDIRPGQQGTFPQEDWNRYRHPALSDYFDMNHPHESDDADAVRELQVDREIENFGTQHDPMVIANRSRAGRADHEQLPLFNDRRHP